MTRLITFENLPERLAAIPHRYELNLCQISKLSFFFAISKSELCRTPHKPFFFHDNLVDLNGLQRIRIEGDTVFIDDSGYGVSPAEFEQMSAALLNGYTDTESFVTCAAENALPATPGVPRDLTAGEKESVTKLNKFRDELTQQIDALKKEISGFEQQLSDLNKKYGKIKTLYESNLKRIAEIEKQLQDFDKLSKTNSLSREHLETIIALKAELKALQTNNDTLKPIVDQFDKDINDLTQKINSLKYSQYRIERKLLEVKASIDQIISNAANGGASGELIAPPEVYNKDKVGDGVGGFASIDDMIRKEDKDKGFIRPGAPAPAPVNPTQPHP